MLVFALLAHAHAACAVEQSASASAVTFAVRALQEPIGCRTVTLTADEPVTLRAWLWTPEERRTRLHADHLRPLPGGGWEIGAPELLPGGKVVIELTGAPAGLALRLGPAPAPDLPLAAARETRSLTLDTRHPGWGFADPKRASTAVTLDLDVQPGAEGFVLPIPADARDLDAGGLTPVPLGVSVPVGTTQAHVRYTLPGAAPVGLRTLPVGSLTLQGPAVSWVTSAASAVAVTPLPDGVRFDAPEGGEVRWRVARAGDVPVIPDRATFVAGLEWRFARLSLPEPAVPMSLRGRHEKSELVAALLQEVRALRDGLLPGSDPLHPRQLNTAWRSGWATPVERGLVLHRFLGQEKVRASWVLTGEHADPETFTGYDTVLVLAEVDGTSRWIDPGCAVCAPGEIGTRWLGAPALGGAEQVPRAAGRLDRSLALTGDRFQAQFRATGAAALWVRERIVAVEPPLRATRLAAALGMPEATLVEAEGIGESGAPITLSFEGPRAPVDPFPSPDQTPWTGGWGDTP